MCGAVKTARSCARVAGDLDDPVVHVGDVHDLAHAVAEVRSVRRSTSVATKVRKLPMWARL